MNENGGHCSSDESKEGNELHIESDRKECSNTCEDEERLPLVLMQEKVEAERNNHAKEHGECHEHECSIGSRRESSAEVGRIRNEENDRSREEECKERDGGAKNKERKENGSKEAAQISFSLLAHMGEGGIQDKCGEEEPNFGEPKHRSIVRILKIVIRAQKRNQGDIGLAIERCCEECEAVGECEAKKTLEFFPRKLWVNLEQRSTCRP